MNISVRVSRIFQIKVADLTLNTELVIWSKNLIFGTKPFNYATLEGTLYQTCSYV